MNWRVLFLLFEAYCILQENPKLSPQSIDVLENSSFELICDTHMDVTDSQWGTINQPGIISNLIFSKEGQCKTIGFLNDTKVFETKCYSNATFKVKIKCVEQSYHGQQWYCSSNYITSNTVYIAVQVPIKDVIIVHISGDVLQTVEKRKTSLTCETTEGRPTPSITWTKISSKGIKTNLTHETADKISTTETLTERNMTIVKSSIYIEPVRENNDTRIICEATNVKYYVARKEITIYVQYPPSKPKFVVDEQILNGSVQLISGNNLSVICKSDSYPNPTYNWDSARSEYIGQYLNLSKLNRNETFHCTATNNMTLPDKTMIVGHNHSKLKIHVLFPTTKPVITCENGNYTLNETIYVMRNDNLTLLCHSNGDPAPKYKWLGQTQGKILQIPLIQTHTNRTCIASNVMHATYGNVRTSSSNTSIAIVVSYPSGTPYLQFILQNELAKNGTFLTNKVIVEENSSFTVSCTADGYPPPACTWNVHNASKSPQLTFINISKDATGLYKCFAENMIRRSCPAYEVKSNTSTGLEIDVLYQSKVLSFYIIGLEKKNDVFEVTENETVSFSCSIDSKPESSIALSLRGKVLGHDFSEKSLIHTRRITSCFDDGDYKCTAQNSYNRKPSIKQLKLLVKCAPRLSPGFDPRTFIWGALNHTVTFEFKVIAKPTPVFHWFKSNDSDWNELKTSIKFKIKTSELHSKLTVRNITEDDSGYYKLKIINEIGLFEHIYFLNANASPTKLHFMINSGKGLGGNKFKVNKNKEISIMCFSDSYLPTDIAIRKQDHEQIIRIKNTTSVRHKIHPVSCDDAGEYKCSARNMSTLQQEVMSKLTLFVKCPPMPATINREEYILYSVQHSDVTLQIEVNEYFDEPNNTVFIWYKQNISLPNDGTKYILTTYGFQSNLVIRNLIVTDFGQYTVLVRNSYGHYIHFFKLQEKAQERLESTTVMILLVSVGAFSVINIVAVLAFIGSRHIRRERINRRLTAEVIVDQTTSSHDVNDTHYDEISNVYDQIDDHFTDGTVYMEMRCINSEDPNKYYITPSF